MRRNPRPGLARDDGLFTRRDALKVAAGVTISVAGATLLLNVDGSERVAGENPRLVAENSTSVGFAAGSSILYMSATDRTRTLDFAKAGRATWIRFDVPWHFVESSRGVYNWGFVDNVVNDAKARGFSILVSVVGSPTWAAAVSSSYQSRPSSAATYATFCALVATRYSSSVSALEVWNEPNGRLFFQPNPDPGFYTSMVRAAYDAVKLAVPSLTVIAGALGPVDNGDGLVHPVDFLNAMYANGLGSKYDALSFHPYDYSNAFDIGTLYDNSPMRNMIRMHAAMKAAGHSSKKIWITEYGAPTYGSVTQQSQAQLIFNSIQQWQEVSFGGPIMIYTIRDSATGANDAEHNFGVVTTDYQPKQALYGIEALIRSGVPVRAERQGFDGGLDASLGASVSPVYPMTRGYGYEFEDGTLYRTYNGFFTSPPAVAALARNYRYVPLSVFANGRQDYDATGGFRIFSRPETTGTYASYGAILSAWTERIGFPLTAITSANGASTQTFQNGTIAWSQSGGTRVTYS